ncbi:MAG: MFS transporter [Lachnospiraceae bacterium]|nr:MFS transporter [Lachnospiraceae bacterium]
MCVAALGNAFSKGEAKMITKEYSSSEATVFIMERDSDNNPTGQVFELPGCTLNVSITGTEKIFDGVIDVNDSNADISGVIFGRDISNYAVEYVMGDYADEEQTEVVETPPILVIGVPSSEFMDFGAMSSVNADLTMTSTLEVERVGFKYFSIIVGILFVVFITVTCIFVKEKSTVDLKTPSVKQMFKALLENDQAMTIVITIVLVNSATYITSNLLIYFFKYDLAGSNWTGNYTLFNMFSGGIQIIAMMMFFPLLRKAFNTLKIFYICVVAAIGGYVVLLVMALAGLKSVYPFFVPGFFIMSAVGMLNVVVTIFLANTVDYGHLKNNRRDESVIFSMQTFVVKLASGIAALVASVCLSIFNIKENSEAVVTYSSMLEKIGNYRNNIVETISSGSIVGLRLVMTLAPIIVLVVALLIFKSKYILTDKKLTEIAKELKSREA